MQNNKILNSFSGSKTIFITMDFYNIFERLNRHIALYIHHVFQQGE